jgi:hypothetical protein
MQALGLNYDVKPEYVDELAEYSLQVLGDPFELGKHRSLPGVHAIGRLQGCQG